MLEVRDETRGIRYGLRPSEHPADDAVIYGPWCNGIRKAGLKLRFRKRSSGLEPGALYDGYVPFFDRMDPEEFKRHRLRLGKLVERCGAIVACDPDTEAGKPNLIYGWGVGETYGDLQVLHYLYVQGAFRRHGIGSKIYRTMFPFSPEKVVNVTHPGPALMYVAEKWNMIFNPYCVRME